MTIVACPIITNNVKICFLNILFDQNFTDIRNNSVKRSESVQVSVLIDISRVIRDLNLSSILDLVKYSRTQSLVSVVSLNVQRYKP